LFLRPTYIFSLISILLQTDSHDIQFLDEADLLADHIPILAAPGEVLAEGSRVALKCDLGEGYSVQISFTVPTEIDKLYISNDAIIYMGARPQRVSVVNKNVKIVVYMYGRTPLAKCQLIRNQDMTRQREM